MLSSNDEAIYFISVGRIFRTFDERQVRSAEVGRGIDCRLPPLRRDLGYDVTTLTLLFYIHKTR